MKTKKSRTMKTPDTLPMLRRVVTEWRQFDRNEPVNGGDLVEWFARYRRDVKKLLRKVVS